MQNQQPSDLNTENPIIKLQQIVLMQRQQLEMANQRIFAQSQQLMNSAQQIQNLQGQITYLQSELYKFQSKTDKYGSLLLGPLVNDFISSFSSDKTKTTYQEGFKSLFAQEFLDPLMKLSEFREINRESLLDRVRMNYKKSKKGTYSDASESTKQLRAAMLLSFSAYLQRRTESYIAKIMPNKQCANKTFSKRRTKTCASQLSVSQIDSFLTALKSFSTKGYLSAHLQIIGCRRITEIINCKISDLDLDNQRVYFTPLKKRDRSSEPIPIYLPAELVSKIKEYTKNRTKGYLFTNLPVNNSLEEQELAPCVTKDQMNKIYFKAWLKAQVIDKENSNGKRSFAPRLISHSLRAYGITNLYNKNIDSTLIKEVSAHSSVDSVYFYKTGDFENNITKKLHCHNFDTQKNID